jgi:hypothetical protein
MGAIKELTLKTLFKVNNQSLLIDF